MNDKLSFIEYNRSLKDYARENRKNPTKQEWIIWELLLKNKQFLWYKFTRQKPIWAFILDFYCAELLLWIEIDGWYHNETKSYDTDRDSEIYSKWILIVRFTNEEIDSDLPWIIDYLKSTVWERLKKLHGQ